jgi:hypothetical protein
LPTFCTMWQDEVCHQLFAKGALLIKDVKFSDVVAYFDFISALVVARKRI